MKWPRHGFAHFYPLFLHNLIIVQPLLDLQLITKQIRNCNQSLQLLNETSNGVRLSMMEFIGVASKLLSIASPAQFLPKPHIP